jgi:NAD(P)-dependent dehydrogenase (short-subunit alcohol dehydrogenase family)
MSTSKPIALVTGASSGIGRTSAIALIKAGWRVVLSGRRREELAVTEEMAREVLRDDGKADEAEDEELVLICVGDVSVEDNVREMFEQVDKAYGKSTPGRRNRHPTIHPRRPPRYALQRTPFPLTPLTPSTNPQQNAGISGKTTPIEDLDIKDYLACMNINVTAAVLCTQYATRAMKAQQPQGGRIINNGRYVLSAALCHVNLLTRDAVSPRTHRGRVSLPFYTRVNEPDPV